MVSQAEYNSHSAGEIRDAREMTTPKLVLTLLPPPLSVDHAVLFNMGQAGFADPRHGTVAGRPLRPGFEPVEATRAIRMAVSAALHRLGDATLRSRITGALSGQRRLHADELRPSEAALKRVSEQDGDAARAIGRLAVCRVINAVSEVPASHPLRTLSGRVLLVDVNLVSLLSEVADPALADAPTALRELLLENFAAACVLHVDGVELPDTRPVVPIGRRARPPLHLVT